MKPKIKNYLAGYDPAKHELYSKPNCPRCYGRGYAGKNLTFDEYSECTCLRYRDKPTTEHSSVVVEPVQSAPLSIVEHDELGGEA